MRLSHSLFTSSDLIVVPGGRSSLKWNALYRLVPVSQAAADRMVPAWTLPFLAASLFRNIGISSIATARPFFSFSSGSDGDIGYSSHHIILKSHHFILHAMRSQTLRSYASIPLSCRDTCWQSIDP